MNRNLLVALCAVAVLAVASVSHYARTGTWITEPASVSALPPRTAATPSSTAEVTKVLFTTTDGPLLLELWPKLAPKHVAQFVKLVKAGVFDGSLVIRNEKNFVVQFGGTFSRPAPLTPEQNAVVAPIPAEFSDVKHVRGTVSMARDDDPNSATTSFSILLGPAPHLDGTYTVFGKMSPTSEETLRKIEAEPVVPGTTKPVATITVMKAELP